MVFTFEPNNMCGIQRYILYTSSVHGEFSIDEPHFVNEPEAKQWRILEEFLHRNKPKLIRDYLSQII